MLDHRRYNLWVYIFRSADDPAVWIAHCREIDIVAFGDSPLSARDAIHASLQDVIVDDLSAGLDPLDRGRAPQEIHDAISHMQEVGRGIDFSGEDVAEREHVNKFLVVLVLDFIKNPSVADPGLPAFGYQDVA